MALAKLGLDYGSGASDDEGWRKALGCKAPEDADPWTAALHTIISHVYGAGTEIAVEPQWWTDNDNTFTELEETRRGLPWRSLEPFTTMPYYSSMQIAEYTTGRAARVDGFLFGSGEKLGDWDAFTHFYAEAYYDKATGKPTMRSLECAQQVVVGEFPHEADGIVVRILRGTKATGQAAEKKTQNCYYVLLIVGEGSEHRFEYAALQHVWADPIHSLYLGYEPGKQGPGDRSLDDKFCDDISFQGSAPERKQLLDGFVPKSVAAAAKAAAKYAAKHAPPKEAKKSARGGARGAARAALGASRGSARGSVRARKRARVESSEEEESLSEEEEEEEEQD